MLIEFSVSNYRSIRDRQTLSMVAAPRLRLRTQENVFRPELSGEKFPPLLKVAVLYGPNASGKSNFLRALDVVAVIANRDPGVSAVVPLPVQPFKFDSALIDAPSIFDIHFIRDGVRYNFELHAKSDRIVYECLISYPKGRETLLYKRSYIDGSEAYEFGDQLEGGSEVFETWKKLTPAKVLFIAQAVANSSEQLNQLKGPFEWLRGAMLSLLHGMGDMANVAKSLLARQQAFADEVAEFLRDVDVPISKIVSVAQPRKSIADLAGFGDVDSGKLESKPVQVRTTLTHTSALGDADIRFEDESSGTQNLMGFWLPWSTRQPWGDSARRLLIVDEMDGSLHPKIVVALVEKHLAAAVPTQLIFSTHDTHLMDAKLLRRDQFWITERDENGATQLRSIHDFEGREGEDIEKRYFEGRYRGLPIVRRG